LLIKSEAQNYSPPQGHAGSMNSCDRKISITTGLFSLAPVAPARKSELVIDVVAGATGGNVPNLKIAKIVICNCRSDEI
jgi:hypothetical protein